MKSKPNENMPEQALFTEISTLIEQAKEAVVAQANYTVTLLFWNIGRRVDGVTIAFGQAKAALMLEDIL